MEVEIDDIVFDGQFHATGLLKVFVEIYRLFLRFIGFEVSDLVRDL